MKYKQMLDTNMVPEWRNKYLDYVELDSMLNKAIESKNIRSREKGIDLYFELIKFNQKFANYFSRECQAQLDKINSFHRDKLSEMNGKYRNLQDQLDQILSSAICREIQPGLSSNGYVESDSNNNNSNYSTVASIGELFRNIKRRMSARPKDSPSNSLSGFGDEIHRHRPSLMASAARKMSMALTSEGLYQMHIRHKVNSMARKLSSNFTHMRRTSNLLAEQPSGFHLPGDQPKIFNNNSFIDDEPQSVSTIDMRQDLQYMQSLSAATPQSKKKMVASYKKKLVNLKFAFRELYFNLVLFEQYTQLNHAGFEQILRKHDRMFASTLGRKFYQEHVQTADFYNNLQAIDHLIEGVEHIYTLHFENGNRRKAIEKLEVPTSVYRPSSPKLDFRVGYELGMFAVLFVLVVLIGYFSNTGYDWRTIFRLYRCPLVLIIFLFQAGISIVIWKHYRINHVLIFELNPRDNLSFHHFIEFGSLLGIVWCVSVILFLFSAELNIRPSICPLVVVSIIVVYLFNPTATCHHRARFWLLRILGRIFTAPFSRVRFADFWIADQLVSIVPLFLDLEYLCCFFVTGDVLSVTYLSPTSVSRCVTRNPHDLIIRTVVAALPAWFRCAQCLRRWIDENWLRLHLANAAKYFCMVLVVVLSSVSQYKKSSFEFDTMRIIWMVAAIFTSALTAYWDIIYDFGLFNTYDNDEGEVRSSQGSFSRSSISSREYNEFCVANNKKKRQKSYPFLRKELVYPVWVYYFAIVEDCILRFGWVISISLTEFSGIEAGLVVSLLAPLEMFRRFVWNCIRLENEQLNNCGLFRAVRDIPIEVVAPIDESNLDKVIMMMDSRDGPSMRNRLMKRRTLRPDRVSFMILQPPNTGDPITRRSSIRL